MFPALFLMLAMYICHGMHTKFPLGRDLTSTCRFIAPFVGCSVGLIIWK